MHEVISPNPFRANPDWCWKTPAGPQPPGMQWLECALLAPWPHAFGTRLCYPLRPDQLAKHSLGLSPEQAFWTQQVHGDRLLWADQDAGFGSTSSSRPTADALATYTPGQSVWVSSADCVPVLIASPTTVVAIHAGWRGTAAGISAQVVKTLLDRGIPADSIVVAIGPAISGPVYQVSKNVAKQVLHTLHPEWHGYVTMTDPEPDRIRVDLPGVNRLQLMQMGLASEQISLCHLCTYSQPELFFSYRRQGSLRHGEGPLQLHWSGIVLP